MTMHESAVTTRGLPERVQGTANAKLLLTVTEVAETLGCGRSYVYELIRVGELRPVKLGRLTRIPTAGVRAFVVRRVEAA